jgi:membrane-bound lytic murein transglycosylase D
MFKKLLLFFLLQFFLLPITLFSFNVQSYFEYSLTTAQISSTDSLIDISAFFDVLNSKSEINFIYNSHVEEAINKYLDSPILISRMLSYSQFYFSIFESQLEKYNLPFELKYLAIVESALNPRAKSKSGARGLWQFMYPTGKEYGLNVTSYVDERLDPLKSTIAACEYFTKLYDNFGNWNLVLAAYNAGPGYIQRKIYSTSLDNYWSLRPYLRRETRGYVPKFMAITFLMENYKLYNIIPEATIFDDLISDTIYVTKQVSFNVLSEILCITENDLAFLNPSFKNRIIPNKSYIVVPKYASIDYSLNTNACNNFIQSVDNKEILVDEKRLMYRIEPGDYLGKIARKFNVKVFQIKSWNKLNSSKLNIGDKLVLYVSDNINTTKSSGKHLEYIVQKGDTLWDIAKKYKGLSVYKIKIVNNLQSDNLKPGATILIPIS